MEAANLTCVVTGARDLQASTYEVGNGRNPRGKMAMKGDLCALLFSPPPPKQKKTRLVKGVHQEWGRHEREHEKQDWCLVSGLWTEWNARKGSRRNYCKLTAIRGKVQETGILQGFIPPSKAHRAVPRHIESRLAERSCGVNCQYLPGSIES